tara:strand:+ start:1336 stop:2037 length:702 start_codon:yes stop_codon:yes gene_type:complete
MKKPNNSDVPGQQELQAIINERVAKQDTRSRPSTKSDAALKALHKDLVEAARAFREGPSQQRQGVCDAVVAVLEFLKGQGFSDSTLEPLKRPLWALASLSEQNLPDPLFAEKRKKSKSKRSMTDAIRQGHLAAFAGLWLECDDQGGGGRRVRLGRAARALSGAYFGNLDETSVNSAITYQRQNDHHPLIYGAFEKMKDVLMAEANAVGGGIDGIRLALVTQIKILNLSSKPHP